MNMRYLALTLLALFLCSCAHARAVEVVTPPEQPALEATDADRALSRTLAEIDMAENLKCSAFTRWLDADPDDLASNFYLIGWTNAWLHANRLHGAPYGGPERARVGEILFKVRRYCEKYPEQSVGLGAYFVHVLGWGE